MSGTLFHSVWAAAGKVLHPSCVLDTGTSRNNQLSE